MAGECVQVDKITPILSHCLHTVNVTVECTYNVVFFSCPVGMDDTTVLGKLR